MSAMAQIPRAIGDFSVLPISIPPLPAYPKSVLHFVYVCRSAPKDPTPEDSRSLFISSIPIDSTEAHFRALFISLVGAGRFENITFQEERKAPKVTQAIQPAQAAKLAAHSKKRKREDVEAEEAEETEAAKLPDTWSRHLKRSGSTAVVLLADGKCVELVLKAISKAHKTKKYPIWGKGVSDATPALGPQWLREHNRLSYPDKTALQASIDAYFAIFNRKEQEAAELAKRLRNEPDEDGFVTVTRGGRRDPAGRAAAEEAKRKMLAKEEKKKSELVNFYRFQMREKKKEEQAELLRKFAEDRRKVSAMREKRGNFKPEL